MKPIEQLRRLLETHGIYRQTIKLLREHLREVRDMQGFIRPRSTHGISRDEFEKRLINKEPPRNTAKPMSRDEYNSRVINPKKEKKPVYSPPWGRYAIKTLDK